MQEIVGYAIPVALAAVFAVLCLGILSLFRAGKMTASTSNRLMRWRVLLQFVAICLVALAAFVLN